MLHKSKFSVEAAVANQGGAMEVDTISKNGRSLKSQTSKGIMFSLLLLLISMNSFAQFSGGDGSQNNPYIIKTAAELAQLATYINVSASTVAYCDKYYKLNNDIDLSDYQTGNGWVPIGMNSSYCFKGIFDGNNKKITGLYINKYGSVGLFGYIQNATVKNLGVIDADVTSMNGSTAIVVGVSDEGSAVSNCYSTGSVVASSETSSYYNETYAVGGVVGDNFSNSSISDCYSLASVSIVASYRNFCSGGIVGRNGGNISNSHSTGSVTSSKSPTGGIAGLNYGSVSNCYSASSVISYGTAGGVVGQNGTADVMSSIVSNCYATGSITSSDSSSGGSAGGVVGNNDGKVSNCYATGSVSSTSTYYNIVGGVVGNNYNTVSNCYSTSSISSSSEADYNYAGGIVGRNSYFYKPNSSPPTIASYGSASYCVALNPSVNCVITGKESFGRIIGLNNGRNYVPNIAFNNMLNPSGGITWGNKGGYNLDGEDISIQDILADGTIGGCFTSDNDWTTQNGKLPGLFGNTVDIPDYLIKNTGISDVMKTSGLIIYPNPTNNHFFIECENCNSIRIYDMLGKEILTQNVNGKTEVNISHLSKGIYNVSILSEGKIIGNNKIMKQ